MNQKYGIDKILINEIEDGDGEGGTLYQVTMYLDDDIEIICSTYYQNYAVMIMNYFKGVFSS